MPEAERHELLKTVAALPGDVSVLLIEHDMDIVFRFADAHLRAGERRVLTKGTSAVARDAAVKPSISGEARWLSCSNLRA